MTWAMLAQLLITFGPRGFDLAEKLVTKWNSPDPLTLEDIAEAKRLGTRTAKDAVVEALLRANIPLDSEQGKAMLALVPGIAPVTTAPPTDTAPVSDQ